MGTGASIPTSNSPSFKAPSKNVNTIAPENHFDVSIYSVMAKLQLPAIFQVYLAALIY